MKTKIYMIPGLMCDERLWSKLENYFDDSYELIHVPIPNTNSFDEISELLNFEEEEINLLGFSLGGYVASYYTLKNPKKVKKLMIISSSICTLEEEELKRRRESLELINKFGFKGISRKKVSSLLDEENEEIIKLVQDMYETLGLETLNSQMENVLKRRDLKEELLQLNMDINFYYGDKDRLIKHDWLSNFKIESKNSDFEILDSVSHMLPLEKPEGLSKKIKQWIKG